MSEMPDHELIDSSSQENQSASGEDRTLADLETQKSPAFTPNQSGIVDLETRHSPAFTPNQSGIVDLETRKMPVIVPAISNLSQTNTTAPRNPSLFDNLPNTPGINPVPQKKKRAPLSKRKKVQLLIVAILLLIPTFLVIFELVSAFIIYRQMEDGISHLQAAENIFHDKSDSGLANYFNLNNLQQAQDDIDAAHNDFASLSSRLDGDGGLSLAANLLPAQINTARNLGSLAATGTAAAQQLLKTVRAIAPSIAPAFQKSSTNTTDAPLTPYITSSAYQEINTTLTAITPLVHSMAQDAQELNLNSLPISSKQRETITAILPLLPTLDTFLSQEQGAEQALGWFLGVGGQRDFLVEPMDSSELRATGGFTGQFGDLLLNGAHLGQLKLANIGKYEEDHTDEGSPADPTVYPKVIGQLAPEPYTAWWPIGNFGMRDANLSADFPTSAKIVMNRYSYEFGTNVDGVIMFTPTLIQKVLLVTGPISIPAYKQTVTAQNLENLLHYYQLDNVGIRQEEIVEGVSDNQVARKLFTQRVTQALMSAVTHLPLDKMLALAGEMFQAMKTKDLQIYVTNPQLESLIGKYGSTASLDRSTTHDGLFAVQSNLSASKASQYVATTLQDTVTLDNQGGATHQLQMTLDYQQKGDVYGLDTYRDYVRVYVPENSQFLAGDGFDQYDEPYCGDAGSGYRRCQSDVYGDGSLICTSPVEIGYATSYLNDPYAGTDHPLDFTGKPQNLQSDEAGRAMFGGWVVVPKNCTMKVTLSWYVPPMSKQPYSLLIQAQAGVSSPLDLTIQPAAGSCTANQGKPLVYSQVMDGEDTSFVVKQQGTKCTLLGS